MLLVLILKLNFLNPKKWRKNVRTESEAEGGIVAYTVLLQQLSIYNPIHKGQKFMTIKKLVADF